MSISPFIIFGGIKTLKKVFKKTFKTAAGQRMMAQEHFFHLQNIWTEDESRGTSALYFSLCFGEINFLNA